MNWIAIVFAVAFTIIFLILLWYNIYKKLFTFNDLSVPAATEINNGPIINPMVYQLIYQSSSSTTWTFAPSKLFESDWQKGRVNYLLIAGTMYGITSAAFDSTSIKMELLANCNNVSSSFVGSTCVAPSFTAQSMLLVLGYKFTSKII
jgi:hypothetical protein